MTCRSERGDGVANDGYIKLYRKMMKWGWYTDTNAKCVFLHLLFLAQYEPCFYRSVNLDVGQAVTSIREIATQTGLSIKSVRVAINHLKTTQEVAQLPMGKFSVFTIKNYHEYQGEGTDEGKQRAHKGHSEGTQGAQTLILRSQEVKKSRKEKDIPSGISKKKFGEYDNVRLTYDERRRLDEQLGDAGACEYIDRLSGYLASKGDHYKDHFATIRNWWRKDGSPVKRSAAGKEEPAREITADMSVEEILTGF